jgi:hypothetical protein
LLAKEAPVGRRRIEMFQYRQVLLRLRAGDSVREIARAGLMGRNKLAHVQTLAALRGWLDAAKELPDDEALAAALGERKRVASSTVSSAEPHRSIIERWIAAGVQGRAIHAALKREHGYTGSYSAIVRIARRVREAQPPEVTVRLEWMPGDAAQVDFGAGPMLLHPDGRLRRTWAFVMTLAHSRHQYVEFVWTRRWPPGWAATGEPSSGSVVSLRASSSTTPSAPS